MLSLKDFKKIITDEEMGLFYYELKWVGTGSEGSISESHEYELNIEPMLFGDFDVALYVGPNAHRFVLPKIRFYSSITKGATLEINEEEAMLIPAVLNDALMFCSHLYECYKFK